LKRKRGSNTFELKPFGKLSSNYLRNSNYFINIQHGAIRSSKTTTSIVRWLKFIRNHHFDNFLMTGNTQTSLYRNVLRPMMALLDSLGISYNWRKNEYIEIEGNTCWLMGFNHEGMAGRIPGVTLGGWYADEINTYPKILVDLALDRLSEENSQAFWTMNPDNPYHYLYKEYIENKEKKDIGDVRVWNYTIWDNPNLSKQYIERTIRRYPKGTVDYKRKILGLAAVAEGVIYSRFVEVQNTFEKPPFDFYDSYVLSTDYGAGNVHVLGLFGVKRTAEGNHYHLLDEFYYDVNDPINNGKQLTDDEVVDAGINLLSYNGQQLPLNMWYTPHDASSLRAEIRKRTYRNEPIPFDTYTPDVSNDIQEIHTLFAHERFKISKRCKNSITQAQTYSWDPKYTIRGEDKPLKRNDHCPDMWRGAIMGTRSLMNNPFTNNDSRYESTEEVKNSTNSFTKKMKNKLSKQRGRN
jgi:PBSX family phage terminase large subunit